VEQRLGRRRLPNSSLKIGFENTEFYTAGQLAACHPPAPASTSKSSAATHCSSARSRVIFSNGHLFVSARSTRADYWRSMRTNRKSCCAPRRLVAITSVPPSRVPLSSVTFGAQFRVIIRRLGLDFFLSQFFAVECQSRQGSSGSVCETRPGAAARSHSHCCTSAAQKRELRWHNALNPNFAAAARGCDSYGFSGCFAIK
jgi:hypothetical protein